MSFPLDIPDASGGMPGRPPASPRPLALPLLEESGLQARLIRSDDPDGRMACEALRYEFFVKARRWVAEDPGSPGRERDSYDDFSYHLGVFQGSEIAAYLRVLPWLPEVGFMLEREFRPLVGGDDMADLRRPGSVEVSRLAVRKGEPLLQPGERSAVELLLKLLYRLSLVEGYRHFYVTVEKGWLRVFRRAFPFPFVRLGQPYVFPDGTETVAAYADLEDMEKAVREEAPDRFYWYRSK
jgi:N-acyl-L-homoserine lactone synthetase